MGARTKSIRAPRDADRPTLLMVGSGDPMDAALRLALDRHGLFVESVGLDDLRPSVQMTAPDLILLLGDAAEQGGAAPLALLAADASSAAVPVVLLAPDAKLETRMHAFRHGAMAVVPRSASADAVARHIARLAREMSEHFEEKTGEIGEATFDELVELVQKELRSGILSVHAPSHKGGPMRVVLGAGRPVAQAVQEFVARLRPHVTAASPMYYQFHTSAGGPVELLDMEGGAGDLEALARLRVLLVDDDPARADTLAQELRARGSLVFVTDTAGRGLERAVGLDPQVAIVDAAGLEGPGFEVVRSIRKDLRLRWASILVAPWDDIWPRGAGVPDMEKLAARIDPLLVPERDLVERATAKDPFDVRLESTGPGRMLRVLVASGANLHLTVRNPKAVVELDLAEGLLVGARARSTAGEEAEGTAALATLLTLGSGRVHVERRPNPSVANIMTPVDEALSAASTERSVVPLSSPPEPLPERKPTPRPAEPPPPPSGSADRWSDGDLDRFVPLEEDDAGDKATMIRDLHALAQAGEALLVEPSTPPPATAPDNADTRIRDLTALAKAAEGMVVEPSAPPPPKAAVGAPVAANERNRPARPRRSTLQMGAPAAIAEPVAPPLALPPAKAATARPAAGAHPPRSAKPAPPTGAPRSATPARGEHPEVASPPTGALPPRSAKPARGEHPEVTGGGPGARPPAGAARSATPAQGGLPEVTEGAPGAPATPAGGLPSSPTPSASHDAAATPSTSQLGEGATAPPTHLEEKLAPPPIARRYPSDEPTLQVPRSSDPPKRSGARAVALACVVLASTVLAAVLGLIGYRYSGWHHPALDRALVLLGAPPADGAGAHEPSDGAGPPPNAPEGSTRGERGGVPRADETPSGEHGATEAPTGEQAATEQGATGERAAVNDAEGAAEHEDEAPTGEQAAVDDAQGTTEDETGEQTERADEAAGEEDTSDSPDEEPVNAEAEAGGSNVRDLLERAERAGSSELAERIYRRVLELEPREHHAMVGLGRLLLERGAHAEAAEQLRGAVQRRPRRAAYRIWLGDALAGAGDAAGARRAWQEALELEPENRQARQRLGQ